MKKFGMFFLSLMMGLLFFSCGEEDTSQNTESQELLWVENRSDKVSPVTWDNEIQGTPVETESGVSFHWSVRVDSKNGSIHSFGYTPLALDTQVPLKNNNMTPGEFFVGLSNCTTVHPFFQDECMMAVVIKAIKDCEDLGGEHCWMNE